MDLLTAGKHDLRVLHVPGDLNQVADALSRGQFERAIQLQPLLEGQITLFEPYRRVRSSGTVQGAVYSLSPPRVMLGVLQK